MRAENRPHAGYPIPIPFQPPVWNNGVVVASFAAATDVLPVERVESMATRVEVLGVHPVEADEPCHLIELIVRESTSQFEIGAITQEVPGEPQDNWQVPWDEVVLDADGESTVADHSWYGNLRIAFFFHYLDQGRPLITPFGNVSLPDETPRPARLAFLDYEPP